MKHPTGYDLNRVNRIGNALANLVGFPAARRRANELLCAYHDDVLTLHSDELDDQTFRERLRARTDRLVAELLALLPAERSAA